MLSSLPFMGDKELALFTIIFSVPLIYHLSIVDILLLKLVFIVYLVTLMQCYS